ncbi:MAG: YfiR family protein [Verrucomicrobiales bacterium]|nr:YfiR family protein [Verrucomicrobiales bacterium]
MAATPPTPLLLRAIPSGSTAERWRWLAVLVFAVRLTIGSLAAEAVPTGVGEYQLKANFLVRFLDFVHWPSPTSVKNPEVITIGVLGPDPFGTELDKAVRGADRKSRRIAWKVCRDVEEARQCHILFVSRRDAKDHAALPTILAAVPVLTVGEGADFARQGGMVGLVSADRRIQIEINTNRAARAGLRIDPHLLQLARIVRDETEEPPTAK